MTQEQNQSAALVPTDSTGPHRIAVFGAAGALGEKLSPFYEYLANHTKGRVEIYAADIVTSDQFKPNFTGFTEYFNIGRRTDKDKLLSLGHDKHFDLSYDATWPDARLFNLVRWSAVSDRLISTKPLTAVKHYEALRTLAGVPADGSAIKHDETHKPIEGAPSYEDVIEKLSGHDHYLNKPAMAAVLGKLPKLHSQFGRFFRVTIVITEQRNVNHKEEQERVRALDEGMIPDLGSHGVMIIQRLTPEGLVWEDAAGNRIKRLWRRIVPTACVRAQMRNAMCQGDTACIVEYEVVEVLCMVDEDDKPIGTPLQNIFFVLVVCGKGFRAETFVDRDLKAVEIAFQGQGGATGIVDLGTNQVNTMLASVLGSDVPGTELRAHGGINLPMFDVTSRWAEFTSERSVGNHLFQPVDLLFDNMRLMKETMGLTKPGILPTYEDRGELIHQFLNTHVDASNGFRFFGQPGSGWPPKEAPMFLMIGRPPGEKVD